MTNPLALSLRNAEHATCFRCRNVTRYGVVGGESARRMMPPRLIRRGAAVVLILAVIAELCGGDGMGDQGESIVHRFCSSNIVFEWLIDLFGWIMDGIVLLKLRPSCSVCTRVHLLLYHWWRGQKRIKVFSYVCWGSLVLEWLNSEIRVNGIHVIPSVIHLSLPI